jgi:aspartyl-tRNA(Asn)/glutamyl-tRNA(Gln) amidotransferase subunit B
MELETIIGLEIHAQLSTKSKLFCNCDNDAFDAKPNTRVCPVCMGFPGMLPVLNEDALSKGVRGAAALKCKIQEFSKFDRKNYFYPDLPNGFQISQFDQPIALKGKVEIEIEGKKKVIGITRVHLENDAGKLTHEKTGTLCDYNRSGTPLIEIVTEPDMRSPEQAQVFAKEIQKILRFVDASDADMEKGMMRFDASISMRPVGDKKLYPRGEIKNLNSFASLLKALQYEEKKQRKLWEKGEVSEKETTLGWLDDEGKTHILRDKESAHDYRYFPEPDLPPVTFTKDAIKEIEDGIPELPLEKVHRYRKEFELSENDALKLAESLELSEFFETASNLSKAPKKAANMILSVILADPDWKKTEITPEHIADTLDLIEVNKVSATGGKQILEAAMKTGDKAKELMETLGLEQVSDSGEIEVWIGEVLEENEKTVAEFKAGKEKVIGFLVGQVMKKSGGSANPSMVQELMKAKLNQ